MKIIPELCNHMGVFVRGFLAFLAVTSCVGGNATVEPPTNPPATYRVLFIGNSLTYFNDLPATVAALAESANVTIHVASAAGPNLALIDHVQGSGSNALDVIGQGGWNYVVLQQGPSSLSLSRDTLLIATRLLNTHVEAIGARSALFMVWPESSRFAVFDDVRDSYRAAAEDVGGLFLPAGEAWRAAWTIDPQLPLYGPDGYHPSELGTYLAALVIYEGITGNDSRALPDEAIVGGRTLNATRSRVRLLQDAAHQTVMRFSNQ